MLFFLDSLKEMIQRLERKYDVFRVKGGYLNERQKKIRVFIGEAQPVRLGDLVKFMPGISVNTLKKDLQYLEKEQFIDSAGKNKGTVYIIKG